MVHFVRKGFLGVHYGLVWIVILQLAVSGCSTMKGSLAVGIGSGAAAGAITGASLVYYNKNSAALQGALVGAVIGGVASFFIHRGFEKRDDLVRKETLFNLDRFNVSSPVSPANLGPGLTVPTVETQWIDTQVQGKKLIEGHRIWIMTEDPEWVPSPTIKKEDSR